MSINSQNTNVVFQTLVAQNGVQVSVAGVAHRLDLAESQFSGMQHARMREGTLKRSAERPSAARQYPTRAPWPVHMRPQLWARMVLCGTVSG